MKEKQNLLFLFLGMFFVSNAVLAEFIGVKIFSLEQTLGLQPVSLSFFGQENLSFNLTAGVLLWPIVFIFTDIINEYFGRSGVRLLSFISAGLIGYAYIMVYFSMGLVPAEFWIMRDTANGQINMNEAFNAIFGQGLWIIIGSLIAFLIGQLVDVTVFQWVRKHTGTKWIWARATGSTLVSQFIDSFVVLFIAFYFGADWSLELVLAIGVVNYIYKLTIAVFLTPILYVLHAVIDGFLGRELSHKLIEKAATESEGD
ncbi:MAG: membrane protein [Ignavibacteriaceae bacterium]|nr:MAG: VUT family protein [Chlorobiota bacterium]GJQ33128.1 MAG: membrane protein [Ignavibacteriaceae bacterium]